MLKIIEEHIKKNGLEAVNKNTFIGYFISEDKSSIQLFYALTSHQRYSTHRKAACKKFYEVARKENLNGTYTYSTSFDYEGKAKNLISYNFVI